MIRREFIAGLGSVATWPLAARAQGERVRRIGWLNAGAENDPGSRANRIALLEALARLGWIEGRNLRFEGRFGAGNRDLVRAHAAELVGLAPDVIVTVIGTATQEARRQTQTIPIVFVGGPDAVAGGLVRNIARPLGNITGFSGREPSIAGKCLELLKEAVPSVTRVANILNPDAASGPSYISSIEAAAPALGLQAIKIPVRNAVDTVRAIDAFTVEPNGGLLILSPPHPLPFSMRSSNLQRITNCPRSTPIRPRPPRAPCWFGCTPAVMLTQASDENVLIVK
jgi:putative tryptophan/tyrosine transport system substrate-binding protein